MKKQLLIASLLILTLSLSACGTQPSNSDTSSPNNGDTSSKTVESSGTATSNSTDEFLKTITAETAEAKGVCGADLTWYYKDNVLVIKGTGDMTDWGSGSLGSTASPWKIYNDGEIEDKISWVIIDEGCNSVGENAFFELSTLSKVYLPDTIKVIREDAFGHDNNLKELTIPASVEEIENGTFYLLDTITLTFLGDAPGGLGVDVNYGGSDTITINYSGSGFEPYIEELTQVKWVKQ